MLGAASSVDGLLPIARALGIAAQATPLDAEAVAALGLDGRVSETRLSRGPGSLRALSCSIPDGDARAALARIAAELGMRGSHVLWVLLVVVPAANRVLIAVPTPGRRGVRLAALVADRARITDSDAETLRLLAAAGSADDLSTHARFAEILGRDALSRTFFRKLDTCVTQLATSSGPGRTDAKRPIALLYASRLLFLAFLESKGWLDADPAFLGRAFDTCMERGGGFHERVLLPLFFGTLNTPIHRRATRARQFGRVPFLNGGLFTRTAAERECRALRFSDEACGAFFTELLSRFRFTSLEETSTFEEAAIDPEMLGRAFECLMAPDARRASGAFYTPHELVERVTLSGLEAALAPLIGEAEARELLEGRPPDSRRAAGVLRALDEIRLLDPACGSGAFLVHGLDRLAALRVAAGDAREPEPIRRNVLARSLFGVDLNPTAVWLCQLRLWLSIVIESRQDSVEHVRPLPNLDRNIRVGDSLVGPGFTGALRGDAALRSLRERYSRSTGVRKTTLARLLDREERRLLISATVVELESINASRRDFAALRRGRDLFGERYRPSRDETTRATDLRTRSAELRRSLRSIRTGGPLPFAFASHFADVSAGGGFTLVVGNPPWVRPHRLDGRTREALRRGFTVARSPSWAAGASAAGASTGFSSQVDLAAVFVERSLRLLAPRGALSLLLPAKLWRSLSAGGMRALVSREAHVVRVEDYSDVPATFDAAVYPGLLVASRVIASPAPITQCAVLHRARHATSWTAPTESIPLDSTPGAPWLLMPPEVRRAFQRLRDHGDPLGDTRFGRPLLGVKCGLNEAFIVRPGSPEGEALLVQGANGRHGRVEAALLRPVARGEQVRPWSIAHDLDRIVWTHGPDDSPLKTLPAGAAQWLAPFRRDLAARADARSATRWWSLFRTAAAASDCPRVVWADIGRTLRATVLDAGDDTVPLNTCYVARCPSEEDALALAALLNSALATAWLSVLAEPARGGYRRYLGWTMSLLPVPARWDACRHELAAIARRAMASPSAASESEALGAICTAFAVRQRDVDPLLAWASP